MDSQDPIRRHYCPIPQMVLDWRIHFIYVPPVERGLIDGEQDDIQFEKLRGGFGLGDAGARRRGGRGARPGPEAEHSRHHGRRYRLLEHQRLQSRNDGLSHAQHRPHRQRRRHIHRLLRPAVLHRRPRRLHHRTEPDPHRPAQGRPALGEGGPFRQGPDAGRIAEAPGLCDRAVRQEPSRRPQRIPAHRARLRRVLRQPLSPQRGRRAGKPGLPQGGRISEFPRQFRSRAASSNA